MKHLQSAGMDEERSIDSFEPECKAIHPVEISRAFNSLPYASTVRCMFAAAFAFNGPRLVELERMNRQNLRGGVLRWQPGKNQKGWRKAASDDRFECELCDMRAKWFFLYEKYSRNHDFLFPANKDSFARAFNKRRRSIGGAWFLKVPGSLRRWSDREEHLLTLAGLRKTAATLMFARHYKRYGDYHIAAQLTQKEFLHSSPWMTTHHYVEDMHRIDALKYCDMSLWDILYRVLPGGRQSELSEHFLSLDGGDIGCSCV